VTSPSSNEHEESVKPADEPPNDISKPIGDAIPTPVEPGLNQPLPEKKPENDESEDSGAATP
jgi:hypothetical protein